VSVSSSPRYRREFSRLGNARFSEYNERFDKRAQVFFDCLSSMFGLATFGVVPPRDIRRGGLLGLR
jgi:hypothetical protein